MSESFVDLSYRGLSLGRRIKLTRVEPASGYLETPAPMPVGTSISIATEEGLSVDAIVTEVREQVGGTTTAPGMQVTPRLEGAESTAWWTARIEAAQPPEPAPAVEVSPPAVPPPPGPAPALAARAERVTVRPRSHTVPTPPPAGAIADAGEWQSDLGRAAAALADVMTAPVSPAQDHGKTTVMAVPAIDPALLDDSRATAPQMVIDDSLTAPHAIVDDGKRTMAMSIVDPAALGLEVPEETTDVGAPPTTDDKKPNGGASKKRRKRRG